MKTTMDTIYFLIAFYSTCGLILGYIRLMDEFIWIKRSLKGLLEDRKEAGR